MEPTVEPGPHSETNSSGSGSHQRDSVQVEKVIRPRIFGLILDVKTRWNSTYAMLKRVVDLKPAIEMYVATDSNLKKLSLSNDEWNSVSQIVALLKPLYTATLHLSKSKYPSLTTTLPTYIALIKVILPNIRLCVLYIYL